MASYVTRAERSGSIFFRVTGLIRSGQMSWTERPLWYDVYVASPPLTAPDWNVKLPKHDEPVRKIFYDEDVIRAAFYKKFRNSGVINVNNFQDSVSQTFIKEFNRVKAEAGDVKLSFEECMAETEKRMTSAGLQLK